MNKLVPEIGKKYGQWTVISTEVKRHSNRQAYFNVRCNCGREGWRAAHTLESGTTKACKSCCKTANNQNTFISSYFTKVKRRANISKFDFDLTIDYIETLFNEQKGFCALSGLLMTFKPNYLKNQQTASLDRIDNKQGYIKGNVQWVHKDINNMKSTYSTEYFKFLCYAVNRHGSSKCS